MKPAALERLNTIRERCNKARPSPWTAYIEGRDHSSGSSIIRIGDGESNCEDLYLHGEHPVPSQDYDFIAHAREDIPFLLDEVERLMQLLEKANSKKP